VVPVVIAGVFRKGKSFLLNFLHRFLRSGTGGGDWLRDGGAAVQDGFPWRGGPQRDTTGIVCWPEPFLVDDGGGGKKVVLLLDTQGLCDLRTGKRGNGTVFVLSALLASTLIFNLDERFREDEWQMLQQFIALAQAAANATGGNNGEDHDDDHDDDEGHLKLFQVIFPPTTILNH
jgi:atlastin